MGMQNTGLIVSLVLPVLAARRWPPLGLVALVVGAALVPFTIPTGTQSEVNFPMLLAAALSLPWLLRQIRSGESLRRVLRAPFPALLALLLVAGVSLVLATRPDWTFAFALYEQPWFEQAQNAPLHAQLGALGFLGLSFCVLFLVADQVRSLAWLSTITALFIVLGGAYLSVRLVPEVRLLLQGTFYAGADGSLMWTWLTALSFAQAAFNRRLPAGVRFALAALVCAAFYTTMVENRDWLAGWIPALIAMGAALWLGKPRLALVVSVAGLVAFAARSGDLIGLVMSSDNQYSLTTRVAAWRILAEIVVANPVFGLGPANYYHVTHLLPILGWNVKFSSHNNYVDLVAQTGLLGFACFALFVWQTARIGWALRHRVPSGFAQAYVIGALAGLVGTLAAAMLGDWFLPFVYNVGFNGFRASFLGWFFLGGLVALDRIYPR